MPLNIKTVINISEPFRSGSAVVHQTISFPHEKISCMDLFS